MDSVKQATRPIDPALTQKAQAFGPIQGLKCLRAEGIMEVVIETQEEAIEQPAVIELSAECLSMVGGGLANTLY